MRISTDVEIRPAQAEDWPLIWPFFSRIVEAGQTYAYPDDLTEESGRDWWMEARPGRGAHIGTASFMVDPAYAGRGVGRMLGRHIVNQSRADRYHGIQFNVVVETNQAAVALWLSLGFEILATVPQAFAHREHGLVGLHMMYQKL